MPGERGCVGALGALGSGRIDSESASARGA
jgi:hypothetical protein